MMEFGLIGEHLGHSFSKEIHGRLSDRPYELREIPRDALAKFLTSREFKGINVTIPYKEAVLPLLDFVSPEARQIGAVNTIVNRDGRLFGYNTDYFGFSALADRLRIDFKGKRVLILGAGGAAKTVAAVATDRSAASVTHAVRRPKAPGQIPLSSLGSESSYKDVIPGWTGDLVVNCTPAGMFPHEEERIIDLGAFPRLEGAIDLIYNPLRTDLILDALSRGVPAEGGLYMLVAQAVKAREYFDGIPGPAGDDLFESLLRAKRNLVLIGMPASGKSTIGKALSEKTGRPFADTDSLIVQKAGKPIPQIFAEEGEAAFRALESDVIQELSPRTGLVIATGGGAVLDPQNVRRLSRNGLLCFIRRDPERLLSTADRPLSSSREAMLALYESRREAYRRATERVIDNNGSLEEALRQFDALI
ncbi:MAG: hypothetical protein K5910_02215 [Bacteroidales bacterium]|nr:hypothetical protein [Bacteroidales bacterium]